MEDLTSWTMLVEDLTKLAKQAELQIVVSLLCVSTVKHLGYLTYFTRRSAGIGQQFASYLALKRTYWTPIAFREISVVSVKDLFNQSYDVNVNIRIIDSNICLFAYF